MIRSATAIVVFFLALTSLRAEKIALTGATIINPDDGKTVENGTVFIDGNMIGAAGPAKSVKLPDKVRTIDCRGKFIVPGYIDTHVHFFQSADLFTRPDVVDLTKVRSYADEVNWIRRNLMDTLVRYLRCGITGVIDVGGPMWNFAVRERANSTASAPRMAAAGPLISSVARPQLDLGDPPIVKIDTPDKGREFVRKLAEKHPDYIKVWYIVTPEQPASSFRPVVHAVIEESHSRKLRVAVHATELEAARVAVEEGADLLVHSVTDKPLDDEFVRLMKEHGTMLTPTLVVFERYGLTFCHKLNLTKEELRWGSPDVIATLDVTKLPADKMPQRIKDALAHPDEVQDKIKKTYEIAFTNLKTLQDAGIPIAAGTDAGNIGTIHGAALFREFQLMKEAGLTNQQILRSTTTTAAKAFGGQMGPKMGSVAPGHYADLVVLNSNPLDDIGNASDIKMVFKNGILYSSEPIKH